SGENIASFGEAAMGAVSTVMVARKLGVGRFINKEVQNYRKASPQDRRSLFQHPIPATMTRTYEAMFGGKWGSKEAADSKRGKGA
ncbi:MAG: hypothetical protein Q7J64_00125, partial [Elusimicrobiota bacterium]|nr:hypothetical protein [Elusimicrobiota bacterium]